MVPLSTLCRAMEWRAIVSGDARAVEEAIKRGADVNSFRDPPNDNRRHYPPLHTASGSCAQPAVVQLLCEYGADVNRFSTDPEGQSTALWQAALHGNARVIPVLLAYGADPTIDSSHGYCQKRTPLQMAIYMHSIMEEECYKWEGVIANLQNAERFYRPPAPPPPPPPPLRDLGDPRTPRAAGTPPVCDEEDAELLAALAASRQTAREEEELRIAIAASLADGRIARPRTPEKRQEVGHPSPAARWTVSLNGFQPYDDATNRQIEDAFAAGDKEVRIRAGGKDYRIDFANMRQVSVHDATKRREVRRDGYQQQLKSPHTPATTANPRHKSRAPIATYQTEGHPGRTLELCHETDEDAARLIQSSQIMRNSPDVYPDGRKSLYGPLIYFAESAGDAAKKAHKHGVVLQATVEVGVSVVVTKDEAKAGKRYTPEALRAIGCDSVKGVGMSTGNEWCAAGRAQVSRIRVADYIGTSANGQLVSQPWWLWPSWVQSLADRIGVVDSAVERTAERSGDKDRNVSQTVRGVRINSAGRPIKDNGQFMSYAEARAKGWKATYAVSSNPTGPRKADGTPDMRYAANRAASTSGPLKFTVSNSPTGPCKADGTPDMRYAANRAASSSSRHAVSSTPLGPLKADGTPDMRYKVNRTAGSGSYSPYDSWPASQSSPLSFGSNGGGAYGGGSSSGSYGGGASSSSFSGSSCYRVSSNPAGPLKADGTPDMRYAANRSGKR